MNADLRNRVLEVYAEVDAAISVASPRCAASGRCCKFKEYQHTLFMSHFEAEILLESAPPFAKPVSSDNCPFQVNNLCMAREVRPLGCRIYFCDPAFQEQQSTLTEAALKKLKQLADSFGTGWRYAPLHVFLNESKRPQDRAVAAPAPARRSLPLVG